MRSWVNANASIDSRRGNLRDQGAYKPLPNHITAIALDMRRFRERTNGLDRLSKREPRSKVDGGRNLSVSPPIEIYLLEQQISRLIRVEKAKERYLPATSDSSIDWLILLDLAQAHLRDETVYSGLLASSLSLKERQLWSSLARLEGQGLVDGMYAPCTSCRIEVWLTEYGVERMTRVLTAA